MGKDISKLCDCRNHKETTAIEEVRLYLNKIL